MFKNDKLPDVKQLPTGTIVVIEDEDEKKGCEFGTVAILERQTEWLKEYALSKIKHIVKEVGSGVLELLINGAKNILKRRSLMDIKLHTPKKIVLNVLVNQYLERLKGCNSAPLMDVIRVNPYFADLLEPQECG